MSRLIDINEDTQLPPEEQGYEVSYAVFEDLPKIKTFQVNEVIVGDKEIKNDPDLADPLSTERMKWLQEQVPDIQKLKHKLKHNKLDKEYYKMEDDLLK